MTPEERQRRIKAAAEAAWQAWPGEEPSWSALQTAIVAALDAADEAVPVLPVTWDGLLAHLDAHYPAEVFDGSSGDEGARIAVLARKLAEAESRHVERMAPAVEYGAEQAERADRAEAEARRYAERLVDAEAAARDFRAIVAHIGGLVAPEAGTEYGEVHRELIYEARRRIDSHPEPEIERQ